MEQMLLKHLLTLVFTDEEEGLGTSFLLFVDVSLNYSLGVGCCNVIFVTLQVISAKVMSQNRRRKIINLHCDFLFPPRNHVQ